MMIVHFISLPIRRHVVVVYDLVPFSDARLLSRLPPREPCVGAENDAIVIDEQLEINLG